MRINNLIIMTVLFIFMGTLHFLLVYELGENSLFDKSLELREVKSSQELEFLLEPQNYFMKIKLFKDGGTAGRLDLYLNNKKLEYEQKKEKDDYVKFYFTIKKELIEQKNNIFTIMFQGKLPKSISINLSNFKKRLTKDIVLIQSDNKIIRNKTFNLSYFSTGLIFLLWLILVLISRLVLKSRNVFEFSLFAFLPSILIFILFLTPLLFGYRIIITNYIFWFILSSAVGCVILVLSFKKLTVCFKYLSKKTCKKYIYFAIISFLIVFLVFYFVFEVITHIYVNHHNPIKIFKISDKEISFVLNSNVELGFSNGHVVINKDGYRGQLLSYNKKVDTLRVLFLGDSMVFGFGLNEEETLPLQLSNIINLARKSEVLNLSVTGYNTHQERILFQRKGVRYSPDILIIGFCLNDVGGNIYVPTGFNTLLDIGEFNYRYSDFGFFDKFQYFLLRNSYFYQYILYKWRMIIRNKNEYSFLTWNFMEGSLNNEMAKALKLFKDDIIDIKNICENNKIKLIIIAYGNELQLDNPKLRWLQGWLEKFCSENKIYFLDLLPAFEGLNRDKILIDQGHPSKLGNKILAEYLYNFLKKKSLLD